MWELLWPVMTPASASITTNANPRIRFPPSGRNYAPMRYRGAITMSQTYASATSRPESKLKAYLVELIALQVQARARTLAPTLVQLDIILLLHENCRARSVRGSLIRRVDNRARPPGAFHGGPISSIEETPCRANPSLTSAISPLLFSSSLLFALVASAQETGSAPDYDRPWQHFAQPSAGEGLRSVGH